MDIYIFNDKSLPTSPLRLPKYWQPGLDPKHEIERAFFEGSDDSEATYQKILLSGSPQEFSWSKQWFWMCGFLIFSAEVTWELVKHAHSCPLLQTD